MTPSFITMFSRCSDLFIGSIFKRALVIVIAAELPNLVASSLASTDSLWLLKTRMPRAKPLKDIIMGATRPVIMLVLIRPGLEGIAPASQ